MAYTNNRDLTSDLASAPRAFLDVPMSPDSNDNSFGHFESDVSIEEPTSTGSGSKYESKRVDEWAAAKGSDGIYFYNTRTKYVSWRLPPSVYLRGNLSTGFRFLENNGVDASDKAQQTPPSLDAQRRQNNLKFDYGASKSLVTIFDSVTNSPITPSSEKKSPSDHSSVFHDDSIRNFSPSKVKSIASAAKVLFCLFCSDKVYADSYIKHVRRCPNRNQVEPGVIAELFNCVNFDVDSADQARQSIICKENSKLNVNRRKVAVLPVPTPGKNLREDAYNGHRFRGKVAHMANVCPLCKYRATSERNDFSRHLRECVLHADITDSAVNFAISEINRTPCPFCYHPPISAGLSAHLDKCPKRLDCLRKINRK